MFAEDDIERRRVEREAADRAYNEALTALDRAVPRLPDLPHPPVEYDESQLPLLNERWRIATADPAAGLTGWRRRVAMAIWRVAGPAFERQQAFNAALVDHLNRNVAAHRANRAVHRGDHRRDARRAREARGVPHDARALPADHHALCRHQGPQRAHRARWRT